MSAQELGLPPRFEEAMHRRLGQTGIFIEVNGKYYLNEERLKQIQEQRAKGGQGGGGGGGWTRSGPPTWSRYLGVLLILPFGLIISLVLIYFVSIGTIALFPGEFLIILVIVVIGITLARLLFWRSRRRYWQNQWGMNQSITRNITEKSANK